MRIYTNFLWALFGSFIIFSCAKNSNFQTNDDIVSKANWVRIGPGGGGSTFIPTFSYASVDDFFIRCDMTGAYHTKDGGSTYALINNPGGSSSFAYDPKDSLSMYIGSKTLKKSSDGGKTWDLIFPSKNELLGVAFIGDHADFNLATSKSSLYNQTTNEKADLATNYQSLTIKNIKVDPNNSKVIYFSSDYYFFYTTNAGISWSRIEVNGTIDFIYTNVTNAKEKVYVFTNSNVSAIDKTSWQITTVDFPTTMQPAFSITGGTLKNDGSSIFYALHNNELSRASGANAPSSLWVSKDFGTSWVQGLGAIITNNKGQMPTYATLAAAENDAANVYVVTSNYQEKKEDGKTAHWFGAIKSSDAGRNWEWVWKGGGGSGEYGIRDGKDASNLKDAWVHKAFGEDFIRLIDVGVAPNDGNVAIVTDWYRSMKTIDGGKTWMPIYSTEQPDGSYISNGLDVTTTYGVHFDPFDKNHIAISYTDIGYHHSYNGGKSWFRATKGIPVEWQNTCYWMVFDPKVKDKIWSVWSGLHDFPRGKMTRSPKWSERGSGGVAVSLDGGKSWAPTVEGMGFEAPSTSIVLDENSPVGNRTLYVAAYGKGVFKSIDDGKTWTLRNNGIKGSFATFELTIQEDGTLFLITSPIPQHKNGKVGMAVFMGAIYKSVDGANSWQLLDLGEKTKFPSGLTYDPQNPNILYVGSWSDIYMSDIVGRSVTNTFGSNERIYLEGGIKMSEDRGHTWRQIFDEDEYVYDVTVDNTHPGRLYCNTFSQGAYRSDDYGKTWNKMKDYDFHWGHRVFVDENDEEKVYLTTYGSSVWHGKPEVN
ncbi:MAG: sialidase family protein [Flavobacteriaceae bacterium]